MTKQDLANVTAQKVGLNQAESKVLMDATLTVLAASLTLQKSITIPHFGTFDVRIRKGHKFFNLIKSKIMFAPQKYSIFFHPSSDDKEKIHEKLRL